MAIYLGFVLYLKVRASGRLRHGSCLVHDDDGPGDLSSQTSCLPITPTLTLYQIKHENKNVLSMELTVFDRSFVVEYALIPLSAYSVGFYVIQWCFTLVPRT
jgi:hypothetical protein